MVVTSTSGSSGGVGGLSVGGLPTPTVERTPQQEDQIARTAYVSEIDCSLTDAQVLEFISLCGKV